jgi:sigma-B regulation protein RsbU (phosphoserine phosphatase)
MEKELALARRVQLDLLPDARTAATQIEFAGRCAPAWQVGGDLYDVFDTGDGQTALILGDVSGKGVSAALLMGVVQGAVRASCAADSAIDHEHAAEHLNDFLCGKTASERFVTLFWSYVNPDDGILRYVNAGHCPPLLVRGGENLTDIVRLETGGPVLGVLPGARYEQGEIAVQPGDLLVLFSDGIIEATDSREEQFGEERLIAVIERQWAESPPEICDAILAEVRRFLGKESAQDDQTVVITRFELRERESTSSTEASGLITAG